MATLKALLDSPDQSVRLKAALSAGTYPESEYIPVLIAQCAIEPDFFVRDTLSWALMRHDLKEVLPMLTAQLNSTHNQARSQALHTLSKIGDKSNYGLITHEHLLDSNDEVATTAWRSASLLVPDEEKDALVKILVTQLGRGDGDTQFALTRFLCAIGEPIVQPLQEVAQSDNETIRLHAEITLIRYEEMKLEFDKKEPRRKQQ